MNRNGPRARQWMASIAAVAALVSMAGCTESPQGDDRVELTLAIVPDPPGASEFYRQQVDLFQEQNPGVTVDIIENPADQQVNAMELMFQQDQAPDVFRLQGPAPLQQFNERGWLAPLDDLADDEFLSRFPEASMEPSVSGLHLDGHLVSLPLVWGDWSLTNLLIYNKSILSENGFDEPPATLSEFEDTARKITVNGGGQVFGTAPLSGQALGALMTASSGTPSSIGNGIDLTTGKPIYSDPNFVAQVDMWRELQADGALEPGWESWDGARAFTEFAAGRLAMYPSGAWHVAEIRKLAPDIELGIAELPVPDEGRAAYAARSQAFTNIWSMSSTSEHPEEALKLMDFLSSIDFYRAYYEEFGSFTAAPAAWEEQVSENPDQAAIVEVAKNTIRTAPNPGLLGDGAEGFWAAAAADPELSWSTYLTESIVNNVPFTEIAAKLDARVEELLAEHEAENPDLRDALVFPDYDPLEDWVPGK